MWILAFNLFKPDTWLSSSAPAVMGAILNGIRTLLFDITITVYKFIVLVYSLFEKLCSARLLSNEILGTMANRVGLILGLIMFFYVIFSLVQMLIDPDKITDKENGAVAIVKKSILVIFMLGISNFGFELLYDVQNKVIQSDVISRIILPYSVKSDDKQKFGNLLSFQLMKAFYQIEDVIPSTTDGDDKKRICEILTGEFFDQIYLDNNYNLGYMCLNESVEINSNVPVSSGESVSDEAYLIDFNGFFAIAAGIFVVYIILVYCFKIGVRMIQLALLEIISPMAIVSYLSPKKDNMLSKWKSLYISTYIDVFIRIAIINFVIFLICTIFSENENFVFWESLGYITGGEKLFFTVVIIVALLTFAKKAPDLLKELLPNASKGLGFGLSLKDITTNEGVGMVFGAATGAAIGLLGGGLGGMLGGIGRGAKAGFNAKGIGKAMSSAREKQAKANLDKAQRRLSGARWYDNVGNGFNSYLGRIGGYEKLESEVSSLKDLKADVEDDDLVKGAMSTLNAQYQAYVNAGGEAGFEDWKKLGDHSFQKADGTWATVNGGKKYDKQLTDAREAAYKNLYKKGQAFTEKVNMHNRRFGTKYNDGTKWDDINSTRKAMSAELEKQRAKKPKK